MEEKIEEAATVLDIIRLEKVANSGKNVFWEATITGSTIQYEWGQVGGAIQTISQTILSGKNIGKVNETTPEQQAFVEARSKANKKIDGGYKIVLESGQFFKSASSLNKPRQIIKPMLAYPYEEKDFPDDEALFHVQPKLDGIRCIADRSGNLWSRQGKKIEGVPHIEKSVLELFANQDVPSNILYFDGELYSHQLSFQEITSLVRKEVNVKFKEAEAINFHIYDAVPSNSDGFSDRFTVWVQPIENIPSHIEIVFDNCIKKKNFDKAHDEYVSLGYEGMMIRKDGIPYEYKRTHQLTKYKKFHQEEYEIVDVEKEEHKDALGSFLLLLSLKDQTFFNARPSFSEEEKQKVWDSKDSYIGKIATVKFQELSNDGVPRFPVVLGIRNLDDTGE